MAERLDPVAWRRNAAALEVLTEARELAPADRDIQTQYDLARSAFRPRTLPRFTYESDSDRNRMATARLTQDGWASTKLGYKVDAYIRNAQQEFPDPLR